MAVTTRAPGGLTVKRNGNAFTISWKITDEDYGDGQTLQYRLGLPGKWTAWTNIAVGSTQTSKAITISANDYYPVTSLKLNKIQFRIRGKRRKHDGVNPAVSAWTTKEFDVMVPNRPTLNAELSQSLNNMTTFTWATTVSTESIMWFTSTEIQTRLERESNVSDGSKLSAGGWTEFYDSAIASGSINITEDASVVNAGESYTRWVRIRSRGPQGNSEWTYARHIYAIPYQPVNVEANSYSTAAGGYLCTVNWETPKDVAHPIDAITVQYTFVVPTAGMTCPDGASWTDAQSLAYKDGTDAAAFSIDNIVGLDQCMFVRVNTQHDRNTTYGTPTLAAVGVLTAPTGLSVVTDPSTYRATITVTNNSTVLDSFVAVKYMTAEDPDGFIIGIIPHGQTTITVQCPDWSDENSILFGAFSVVGTSTPTVRADGVTSYAIDVLMQSSMLTYGGSVPAAPTNVTLSMTDNPGTIRVVFDWAWQEAISAELSWADHADAWESTDEPDTYTINNTHASAWNISNLATGKTWYVRVRLAAGVDDSKTFGAYSDIVSIDLSSAPAVPILSLSSAVVTDADVVTASWAFTSTDGSAQAAAEVAEIVNNDYVTLVVAESAQYVTISPSDAGWEPGEVHQIAVRVVSASGRQSQWSDPVAVTVAEPLEIEITSTSLVTQTITVDGVSRTVKSLTVMPLSITVEGAGTGGETRVVIIRAEDYHMERPDESRFDGYEGEMIAIYSQTGEAPITISDTIGSLDDGASYRIIATVQDSLGQSAETSIDFEVHWTHQALIPDARVSVDHYNMVAFLKPVAPTGAALTDVCDIYRLTADKPELIYPGAEFGEIYVDPFPALGAHGGHRFVLRTANGDYITAENMLAWTDLTDIDGDELKSDYSVIDFGSGRVAFEYNTDLSQKWSKDFKETKYLGGSVRGDWNPATSRTGSLSAVVTADDQETIETMRRLAVHPGLCHVRTKDGSSYAADVQVSEDIRQQDAHKIVGFSLSITRVDSDGYDGMTLEEWTQTWGGEWNGLE